MSPFNSTSQRLNRAFNRLGKLSSLFLLVTGLAACTTTTPEPVGLQDGTFTRVSYDQERDETDVTLRSLGESNSESAVQNTVRKDFYLPNSLLKNLSKRADQARERIKSQRSADQDSLRILAVEALVLGQPELVEGYLLKTKNSRKRLAKTQAEDSQLLGIAAGLLGDTTQARRLLTEATGFPGFSASARANLGLIALRQGAVLEALEMFRQAEAAEPNNSRLTHLLAETAYTARKYNVAIEKYKKIISRSQGDLLAHYNLGLAYHYGLRRYSDAKSQFQFVVGHSQASRELRILAEGAFANVRREEEGSYGLATTGFQ
ncbi:hypothetical protein EBU99_00670 [bacterium]|nr:hypothetical protein [bacterium]